MNSKDDLVFINEVKHITSFFETNMNLLDVNSMKIDRILGGLSRKAYKVHFDKQNLYLARIFTKDDFNLSEREKNVEENSDDDDLKKIIKKIKDLNQPSESLFFKFFSLKNLGPELLGEYSFLCEIENKSKTIRFEKFLNGRQMLHEEILIEKYFYKISAILGKMHSFFQTDESKQEKNYIFKKLSDKNLLRMFNEKCNLDLYDDIDDKNFIKEIQTFSKDSNVNKILDLFRNKKQILSHNDIWVGNIFIEKINSDDNNLMEEKFREKLHLIDLEMMDYNFNGYDLGKFLYEPMFGRYRNSIKHYLIPDGFPDDNKVYNFLLIYLFSYSLNKNFNENQKQDINFKLSGYNLDQELLQFISTNDVIENYLEDDNVNYKSFIEKIKYYLLEMGFYKDEPDFMNAINTIKNDCYIGIIASCYWLIIICVICGRSFSDQMDLFQFAKDEFYVFKKFANMLSLNLD